MDEDGYLRVFDRRKDMLNRGGYKIYSVEVENVLSRHPAVLEAAAVGKPCPVLGERVHVFITLKEGHRASGQNWRPSAPNAWPITRCRQRKRIHF